MLQFMGSQRVRHPLATEQRTANKSVWITDTIFQCLFPSSVHSEFPSPSFTCCLFLVASSVGSTRVLILRILNPWEPYSSHPAALVHLQLWLDKEVTGVPRGSPEFHEFPPCPNCVTAPPLLLLMLNDPCKGRNSCSCLLVLSIKRPECPHGSCEISGNLAVSHCKDMFPFGIRI